MADVRALGVFQERVKALFGSLLEDLLLEITQAYRDSICMNLCDRCANNPPESRNNKDIEVGVTSGDSQLLMSFECKNTAIDPEELNQKNLSPYPAPESPRVLTEASEWKEIQSAVDEDKIQATEDMSDDEMQTFPETPDISEEYLPEASDTNEAEHERDFKQEHGDVAVTTEEEEERGAGHLEETQACQTSGESAGAHPKPEDSELHEPEESFQTYLSSVQSQITLSRLINVASTERLKQEDFHLSDLPVRACSVRLQRPEILQRQSQRVHVCSVCDKLFIYKRTLRRHRRLHTGERPHGCSLCSKAFILRRSLQQHKRAHFRRPFSCSQCGKSFRRWRKLRLHWRSHAGEGPFVCRRCGKHCRTLKSLDRHLAYVDHDSLTSREQLLEKTPHNHLSL